MDNKQVAHLWANKSRESANGSHFFFEGDTIYSYGHHFPIARHHKGCVLFTQKDYSVTTSRHKGYVRCACSHLEVFHVDDVTKDPSGKDVKEYARRIQDAAMACARARNPQWKLDSLTRLITEANDFCLKFGFQTRFSAPENFDELKIRAKAASQKLARQTRLKNERIERENQEAVTRWLAGEPISLPYTIQKVYLRVKTQDVDKLSPANIETYATVMQTSKGATVPLSEAEKAFRFVMLKREKGWHRNGEQCSIGEFQLDAVNEQGVIAGCHRVSWDEIERFAKTQHWI